ncbi:MAG: hypothetical protein ACR2RF_29840 [Geminicoccaceae bacterium]
MSLAKNTDLTPAEHLDKTHGLQVAPSTIWRLLNRRDMTYRKRCTPPSSKGPTFSAGDSPGSGPRSVVEPERLVFIDETGASTKRAKRCGRALRGDLTSYS